MPETPMSDSAARTSSSLNGLMIAVTSFMSELPSGLALYKFELLGLCRHVFRCRHIQARAFCSIHAITCWAHSCCEITGFRADDTGPRGAVAPFRRERLLPLPRLGAERPGLCSGPQMLSHILIVGAGQAAIQALDTLRRKGFTGQLTLVGEEPWLPYQRPPLSKKFLSGAIEREKLLIRPQTFYTDHHVQTHLGRRAVEIDRRAQSVRLDDGTNVSYDKLL